MTHKGLDEILYAAKRLIDVTPAFPLKGMEKADTMVVYDAHEERKDAYSLERNEKGVFVLSGEEVLFRAGRISTKTDEGIARLIRYLDSIGIEEALREAGAVEGDLVRVGDFTFEYSE